ncbi:MAG TPA: EAL domain-containing protein [Candidatus Dormibacteraeota bacterium]
MRRATDWVGGRVARGAPPGGSPSPAQRGGLGGAAGAAGRLLLVLGTYYLAARLGLLLSFRHTNVSPIWPPSGIAVAALLLLGGRVWPALTLGAFLANLTTGLPPLVAAAIAAGNTLEYVLAAFLLRRSGVHPSLDRLRDVVALVGLGCALSPLVAATTGTLSLWAGGIAATADLPTIWTLWWLGDGMGILVVTSVLLALSAAAGGRRPGTAARIEGVVLLGVLAISATAVFLGGFEHPYLIYPLAIWAAIRLGQLGATSSTLIVSGIAVWGTVDGRGPFATGTLVAGLTELLLFTGVLAVTAMVLAAAIIAGREAARREMQRQAQLEIEERFRHLYGAAFDGIMVHDGERVLEANHAMAAMFGYSDDAILDVPLRQLIDPGSLHRLGPAGPGGDEVVEVRAVRHGGGRFVAELTDRAVSLGSGAVRVAALRDISDRVTAERLRTMQFAVTRILADADTLDHAAPRVLETMATALDWQSGLVLLVDPGSGRPVVRHGWGSPAPASPVPEAAPPGGWAPGEGLAGRVWSGGLPITVAVDELAGHGAGFPIVHEGRVTGVVTFGGPSPRPAGEDLAALLADIGSQLGQFVERKRVESALARSAARLAALAATDPLTGLPNRREFERALGDPQLGGYSVLAIDVDNLKVINDAYGHEAGDAALQAVGSALRMGLRDIDVVARTGGDEFAALLPGANGGEAAAAAERLRRTMHGITLPRGQARVSVGCAVGAPGEDALRCWAAADEALYRAKSAGRDRFELVPGEEGGGVSLTRMARWESLIPGLISTDGMVTVFQPIVDLATGEVIGYEALGRPAGGSREAAVDELFDAADRLGLGRDLDWVCRRTALQAARRLPAGCQIFVNVGAGSLLDPVHGVDQMLLLLRWAHRRPEEVVLEITERDAVHDLDRLTEVLRVYRAHGFRFALDDVGEGHSTFEVLAAATPEFLKVAGSLVRRVDALGPRGAVDALVAFAATTGAEVIAEGLETAETAATLRRLGVTLGQGFALGRPADPEVWRRAASA